MTRFQAVLLAAVFLPVTALVLPASSSLHAADGPLEFTSSARPSLSAWRQLPVHDGGRIKPLDTYALERAEQIFDKVPPTITLLTEGEDGQPQPVDRKFQPAELVLSWLTQREAWDATPFLELENEELRQSILDGDERYLDAAETKPLKAVSPNDLAASPEFEELLLEIFGKRMSAQGDKVELSERERDAEKLWQRYASYRDTSFSPYLDWRTTISLRQEYQRAGQTIGGVLSMIRRLGEEGSTNEIGKPLAEAAAPIEEAFQSLGPEFDRVFFGDRDRIEAGIDRLEEAAGPMAQMLAQSAEGREMPPILQQFGEQLRTLPLTLRVILYDENNESLRVIPALNPQALEADRRADLRLHPWLDMQTVLSGSRRYLQIKGYTYEDFEAARQSWESLKSAYLTALEGSPDAEVATTVERFSARIGRLAGEVESDLNRIKLDKPDEDAIANSRYPAPGAMGWEVSYNNSDPFRWVWITSFFSSLLFAGAVGFPQVRRSLLWGGFGVLMASLVISVYGFGLRVIITGFAPVTNMYETIIYVAFVVTLLGAWFMLSPVLRDSVNLGWKLSGVPGTPEDKPLTEREAEIIHPEAGAVLSYLLLVMRLFLTAGIFYLMSVAPYTASNEPAIALLPTVSEHAPITANQLTVWLVGLGTLLTSMYFVPRGMIAVALGLIVMPIALKRFGSETVPKLYESPRPFIGLSAALCSFIGGAIAWHVSNQPADVRLWDDDFNGLQPVLRDNFWLLIHVLTIVTSYGAGALAWMLGNFSLGYYLFGKYRDSSNKELLPGHAPAGGRSVSFGRRPPEAAITLSGYVYKVTQVAVLLLVAGTILGGLWADVSWGRFWGWDPKEVWALISALVYLAILHGRFAGWFGNFGLAIGSVLGASAILMSWYGVNFYLGEGLHSYASADGFGEGDMTTYWVFGTLAANWVFAIAAAIRYSVETSSTSVSSFEAGGTPPQA